MGNLEEERELNMISRRNFLKLAALSAASVGLGIKLEDIFIPAKAFESKEKESKFIPSICGMCPAACNIQVEVKNGKFIAYPVLPNIR